MAVAESSEDEQLKTYRRRSKNKRRQKILNLIIFDTSLSDFVPNYSVSFFLPRGFFTHLNEISKIFMKIMTKIDVLFDDIHW